MALRRRVRLHLNILAAPSPAQPAPPRPSLSRLKIFARRPPPLNFSRRRPASALNFFVRLPQSASARRSPLARPSPSRLKYVPAARRRLQAAHPSPPQPENMCPLPPIFARRPPQPHILPRPNPPRPSPKQSGVAPPQPHILSGRILSGRRGKRSHIPSMPPAPRF